jgi:alpha-tubulin suppressor-like RCC1 family protein
LPQLGGQERAAQPKEEEQAQQVQESVKEIEVKVREEQSPRKGFSLGNIDWVLEAVKELAVGEQEEGVGAERETIQELAEPAALVGVKAIAAGNGYTLALTESGEVYAWGLNDHGWLGLGDTENRLTPTKVAGLGRVKAIAAGRHHPLALTESGEVYAWGSNEYGQLGLGDTEYRLIPTKVASSKPTG